MLDNMSSSMVYAKNVISHNFNIFFYCTALQIPQHLQCKTPGCSKQRHPHGEGGYFDYCSKDCRDHGKLHAHDLYSIYLSCMMTYSWQNVLQ